MTHDSRPSCRFLFHKRSERVFHLVTSPKVTSTVFLLITSYLQPRSKNVGLQVDTEHSYSPYPFHDYDIDIGSVLSTDASFRDFQAPFNDALVRINQGDATKTLGETQFESDVYTLKCDEELDGTEDLGIKKSHRGRWVPIEDEGNPRSSRQDGRSSSPSLEGDSSSSSMLDGTRHPAKDEDVEKDEIEIEEVYKASMTTNDEVDGKEEDSVVVVVDGRKTSEKSIITSKDLTTIPSAPSSSLPRNTTRLSNPKQFLSRF
ncbi:hypothetical protein K435DRAFT_860322 [Dendrothele bispora CBS 962.96]|uniref:Uncharacterized protein n=1 Tax=Dendrothele bispora (strain CBS 962.96) TaxID=1314807 RepID=A0A4S8LZH7_DENBC|nr:hypothetical protein K435DRAFT_860322 [Dendrothele bispora CBS 962.96]